MKAYAIVRPPGSQGSADREKERQNVKEFSLKIENNFPIKRQQIEQPKPKVSSTHTVVHIIERKGNKKEPQQIVSPHHGVRHLIQASTGKKGCKIRNLDEKPIDEHSSQEGISQDLISGGSHHSEDRPKEQCQWNLRSLQQSHEEHHKPPHQLPINLSRNQESNKSGESSAHLLYQKQGLDLSPIEIQSIVESYRIRSKRQYLQPHQRHLIASMAKNDEPIIPERNIFQIDEIDEHASKDQGRINLKRHLEPSLYEKSQQSFERNNPPQRRMNHLQVQDQAPNFEILSIGSSNEDIQVNKKPQKLLRKIILLPQDEQKNFESIMIPVDLVERLQSNAVETKLKRLLKKQDYAVEEEIIEEDNRQGHIRRQDLIEQQIPLQQSEESMQRQNKPFKIMRNLLILQGEDGRIATQQIVIPEEFEKTSSQNHLSTHKRQFRIIQLEEPPERIKPIHPQAVAEKDPIIIQPISSAYLAKSLKKPMSRKLLAINNPSGDEIYQQIIVPEEFEIRQASITQIKHNRNILHLQGNNPVKNDVIEVGPIIESLSSKDRQQSLRRSLANNEVIESQPYPIDKISCRQVVLQQQLQERYNIAKPLTQKRYLSLIQFQEERKDKINQPFQQPPTNINLSSVQQENQQSKRSQRLTRNLLATKAINGDIICQEIFLDQGLQQQNVNQNGCISHQRNLHVASIQQQSQNIKLNSRPFDQEKVNSSFIPMDQPPIIIPEGSLEDEKASQIHSKEITKHKRSLLIKKDEEENEIRQEIDIPYRPNDSNNEEKVKGSPQRSYNLSTLKSSTQNIPLIPSSLEESNLQERSIKLARHLVPTDSKLYKSQQPNLHANRFNVYNPRAFLSSIKSDIKSFPQSQSNDLLGASYISQDGITKLRRRGSKWKVKPVRRPGVKPTQ